MVSAQPGRWMLRQRRRMLHQRRHLAAMMFDDWQGAIARDSALLHVIAMGFCGVPRVCHPYVPMTVRQLFSGV